jgi:hypothetical protein
MGSSSWFAGLEQTQTSYLLLAILAGIGLAAALLHRVGVVGWVVRVLGHVVRGGIEKGFLLWERAFAWASWQEFLVIVCGIFFLGGVAGGRLPALRAVCGLATLGMGAVACLACSASTLNAMKSSGATRLSIPSQRPDPGVEPRAIRQASRHPTPDRRRHRHDRRVRFPQPGTL